LHLQNWCSAIWATPPRHFALVILEMGGLTNYLPGLALSQDLSILSLPSS
jgi:hypothetical protein